MRHPRQPFGKPAEVVVRPARRAQPCPSVDHPRPAPRAARAAPRPWWERRERCRSQPPFPFIVLVLGGRAGAEVSVEGEKHQHPFGEGAGQRQQDIFGKCGAALFAHDELAPLGVISNSPVSSLAKSPAQLTTNWAWRSLPALATGRRTSTPLKSRVITSRGSVIASPGMCRAAASTPGSSRRTVSQPSRLAWTPFWATPWARRSSAATSSALASKSAHGVRNGTPSASKVSRQRPPWRKIMVVSEVPGGLSKPVCMTPEFERLAPAPSSASASNATTRCPARRSSKATAAPTRPVPTTATSTVCILSPPASSRHHPVTSPCGGLSPGRSAPSRRTR